MIEGEKGEAGKLFCCGGNNPPEGAGLPVGAIGLKGEIAGPFGELGVNICWLVFKNWLEGEFIGEIGKLDWELVITMSFLLFLSRKIKTKPKKN